MHLFRTRSEAALYVWDYFYLHVRPLPGDEKPWGWIERATDRIRESEQYLCDSTPPDVQLPHARRVRNAARVALRNIARLSVQPPHWTIEWLETFEALGADRMRDLSESAARLVVH